MGQLSGKKIAILVADGFEQSELAKPKQALEEAGAQVDIISPETNTVKGWNHTNWGDAFQVDVPLAKANENNYDGLLLPGGVMNPDKLRLDNFAVNFVKEFIRADKPIAAICHGPWLLINAGIVKGLTMTSWPSIKIDLVNAGANWVDKEVVRDKKVVTSRKPDDIPAFNSEIIKLFSA